MELGELDIAEQVFQGIHDDNNDNEEAKAMIIKVRKEKQRSNAATKERWGGKLGGAAPTHFNQPVNSQHLERPTPLNTIFSGFWDFIQGLSWTKVKILISENIEYVVGAFFALVAVGIFYHVCDRILYQMPSRSRTA